LVRFVEAELGVSLLAAAGERGGDEQIALLEFGLFGLGEDCADRRGSSSMTSSPRLTSLARPASVTLPGTPKTSRPNSMVSEPEYWAPSTIKAPPRA
jgi:hypothetical protein